MDLPVVWSLVLLLAAVWNLIVWPPFLRRVLKDTRSRDEAGRATTFLRVHAVLVSVSLVLAIAIGVLGILTIF